MVVYRLPSLYTKEPLAITIFFSPLNKTCLEKPLRQTTQRIISKKQRISVNFQQQISPLVCVSLLRLSKMFSPLFTTFHHLSNLSNGKKSPTRIQWKVSGRIFWAWLTCHWGGSFIFFLRPKFRPQKALFKDEHHHEVLQTQGACALEAFRAACAGAM